MAALSAGDLTTLRDIDGGYSYERRLYLFNDDSQTVMYTATIGDASPTRGQQSYTLSGGAYETGFSSADIHKYCYVTIGSSAKGDDVSRRVLLSLSGSTLILDYADDYQASNGDDVTIWNFYPVWPRLAWADYSTPSAVVFYQDGPDSGNGGAGIAYAETTQLRPHVRINQGAIIYRDASLPGSNIDMTIDTEVVNPDATSTITYTMTVSPSTLANLTEPVPGVARFAAQTYGRGYIRIEATDSEGGTTAIYRPVIVEDPDAPIHVKEFNFRRPQISRNNNAPTASVSITAPDDSFSSTNEIDWTSVKNESLIIITQEDFFAGASDTITYKVEKDTDIIYFGFVTSSRENHISGQDAAPSVELQLDPLPSRFTYALSITGKTSPSNWLEARPAAMTASGGIYLALDGYSTITQVIDLYLPWGDTQKRVANELFSRGNILAGLRAFANSRLYEVDFRPSNRLTIFRSINLEQSATRAVPATTLTLTLADTSGVRRLEKTERSRVVRTLLSGIVSDGDIDSASRATPYLLASQNVPTAHGIPSEPDFQRVVLASETEGQQFASRLNAIANQPYQSITITFDNRYHHVFWNDDDQWVNVGDVVLATDPGNIRAIQELRNKKIVPLQIRYDDDGSPISTGQGTITVTFQPEATGELAGISLPQPSVPSPTDTTSFPGLYDNVDPPYDSSATGSLLTIDLTSGPYDTTDSGNDWTQRTTGMAATDGRFIVVDPTDSTIFIAAGDGWVEKSTDSGANWTDVTPTSPPNTHSDAPAPTGTDLEYRIVQASEVTPGEYVMRAEWNPTGATYRTWTLYSSDTGATWSWKGF